jgi:hypothetical protein
MDIEYVDDDPLDGLKPVDISLDEREAEKIAQKNILRRRVKSERFEVERLAPPRPVKCPDLTSITL